MFLNMCCFWCAAFGTFMFVVWLMTVTWRQLHNIMFSILYFEDIELIKFQTYTKLKSTLFMYYKISPHKQVSVYQPFTLFTVICIVLYTLLLHPKCVVFIGKQCPYSPRTHRASKFIQQPCIGINNLQLLLQLSVVGFKSNLDWLCILSRPDRNLNPWPWPYSLTFCSA